MIKQATFLGTLLLAFSGSLLANDLVAIKVGRAETVSQGTIEHAVILVEGGKIVTIGQDLPIERGIPVLDRPEWVAMPGLVSCNSALGLGSSPTSSFEPQNKASQILYPRQDLWEDLLELGVTTLALRPAGGGVPGQAVAVQPAGSSAQEMILRDGTYLMMYLSSNTGSKSMFRNAFKEADEYVEKEKKAREKYEDDLEKAKKKKKDDDDEDEEPEPYEPPELPPKVAPILDMRSGELSALIRITRASDWLHLLDVLGDEEFSWGLRIGLFDDNNIYEVAEEIGERGLTVVCEPRPTLQRHTRRDRNIPLELANAGAKIAFVPRSDSVGGHRDWRTDVGVMVAFGIDRQVALRAMTLEPATVLGLQDRVGSLEAGKDANMIFLSGDPFEPASVIEGVMLQGRMVHGEVE